jgi:hypothetical protein
MAEEVASFEADAAYQSVAPGQGVSVDVSEDVAIDVARTLGPGADGYLKNYVNYKREQAGIPAMQSYDVTQVFSSPAMQALARQEISMSASDVSRQEIAPAQEQVPDAPPPQAVPTQGAGAGLGSSVGVPARPDVTELSEAFEEASAGLGLGGLAGESARAQERVSKEEALFKNLGQELKEFKIQPFRAYDNTMFAVVAAISAGLGAAAQSLTGVPNTAVKLINQAVDRDIDAQKAQYNALKDKTNVQNNVYGRAMNALGDAKKAEDVAKRLAYQTAIQRVDASEKRYSQNEQLRATAQRYRDMFALESAKLSAVAGRGTGDRATHAVAAEQGLNEISALIEGFGAVQERAGPVTLALTDMAQSVVGPALFGITKQRDAEVFFRARNALKNTLPALTTSVLKAVGEKGNLSEDEQKRYQGILEKALPKASLVDVFGSEERKRQFTDNVNLIRKVLGLPKGNRERAKELLDQIKQFEG